MRKVTISRVLEEKDTQERKRLYSEYVKGVTPTFSRIMNLIRAFVIGGLICTLGQALTTLYQSFGCTLKNAQLWTTITLIILSIITTGLGWYGWLARYAGAGTVVPITGFANSVASCAIEFRTEGQVYGIGSSIFKIAGPVILFGIIGSWTLGVIYLIGNVLGLT